MRIGYRSSISTGPSDVDPAGDYALGGWNTSNVSDERSRRVSVVGICREKGSNVETDAAPATEKSLSICGSALDRLPPQPMPVRVCRTHPAGRERPSALVIGRQQLCPPAVPQQQCVSTHPSSGDLSTSSATSATSKYPAPNRQRSNAVKNLLIGGEGGLVPRVYFSSNFVLAAAHKEERQ